MCHEIAFFAITDCDIQGHVISPLQIKMKRSYSHVKYLLLCAPLLNSAGHFSLLPSTSSPLTMKCICKCEMIKWALVQCRLLLRGFFFLKT